MSDTTLQFRAELNTENFERGLEKINDQAKELFATLGIGFAAIKGLEFVKDAMNEFRKIKVQQAEINQLLKNSNNYNINNVNQLKQQREEMVKILGISQEVSSNIQKTVINAFPNAGIERLKGLSELGANYQAATGKDANTLIRGLVGGNLSRIGGESAKEITDKIKQIEKNKGLSNEKRLKLEYDFLSKHYEGAAKAAVEADPSKRAMLKFRDSVGHLADEISLHFLPKFTKIIDGISDFIDNHFETIKNTLVGITEGLKDVAIFLAGKTLLNGLKRLTSALSPTKELTSLGQNMAIKANIVYLTGVVAEGGIPGAGGIPGESALSQKDKILKNIGPALTEAFKIKMGADILGGMKGGKSGEDISTIGNFASVGYVLGRLFGPEVGVVTAALSTIIGVVYTDWEQIKDIWNRQSEGWVNKVVDTFSSLLDKITELIWGKIDETKDIDILTAKEKNPLISNLSRLKYQSPSEIANYIRTLNNVPSNDPQYGFKKVVDQTTDFLKDYKDLTQKESSQFYDDYIKNFGQNQVDSGVLNTWLQLETKNLKLKLIDPGKDKGKDPWTFGANDNPDETDVKGPRNTQIFVNIHEFGKVVVERIESTSKDVFDSKKLGMIKDHIQNAFIEALDDAQNQVIARGSLKET